jgi:hypothetical protein
MKINLKNKEFEISWLEVVAFIVTIYLLITGNLSVLVELIKSLVK